MDATALPIEDASDSRWLAIAGVVTVGVAAIVALSLVLSAAIAFDPEAWIVWGREALGPGSLTTGGGPAWKPLPVLVLAPLTVVIRGQADVYLWLFIARAGAVLAVVGVAALARRIAGWCAAVIAGLLVVLSPWWFYNGMLGNAEPLLVALIAGAALAYDRGAVRTSGVMAVAACLVRPETWPFAVLYGGWLAYRDRRLIAYVAIAAVFVLLAWTVPEWLHTGTSAIDAATGKATASSARYSAVPFLAVFKDAFDQLSPLPAVLALVALGTVAVETTRTQRHRKVSGAAVFPFWEWLIGAFAVGWMAIVGVMAEIGFAGNPRYLVPALAALAVCAGVTAARLTGPRRWRQATAVVVVAGAALVSVLGTLRTQGHEVAGHAQIAAIMRRELSQLRCPGLRWTFAANRSTLAQLTGQTVGQSAHPVGYHIAHGRFVRCAPASYKPTP